MAIKDRIKQLRQEHNWSQTQLAQKMGIHQKQVSAYERGRNVPSTDVLIKLADIFDVSLDYLAFEAEGQSAKVNIKDRELLRRFEEIDKPALKQLPASVYQLAYWKKVTVHLDYHVEVEGE